jgi:hypothetical protein
MKPMPMTDYLRDPCPDPSFSSGAARAIIERSPLHAWHDHPRFGAGEDDCNNDMDVGTALHALFLERDISRIHAIDAKDWRTNAAKEERDAARAEGKIPLLKHQCENIPTIAEASWAAVERCTELNNIFDGSHIEQCCLWQERGTWCRARPDLVSADMKIILNYKTTPGTAAPSRYQPDHLQAYHHAMGVKAETGSIPLCLWLVQETAPPYVASVLGMSPTLAALARSQWEYALGIWRECVAANTWPGYPDRVCWIEAKPWEIDRWAGMPSIDAVACSATGVNKAICRCVSCAAERSAM